MILIADGRLMDSSRGPVMTIRACSAFGYCSFHDAYVVNLANTYDEDAPTRTISPYCLCRFCTSL